MKWCHIGIKAKDSESSIRFYREILGLDIVDTVDVWGKKFTFVGNDTIQIEIEQANPGDIQVEKFIAGLANAKTHVFLWRFREIVRQFRL